MWLLSDQTTEFYSMPIYDICVDEALQEGLVGVVHTLLPGHLHHLVHGCLPEQRVGQRLVALDYTGQVVDQELRKGLDVHVVQLSKAEFELVAQILPDLLHPHHHLYRGDGLVQGQVTAGSRGLQGVGHHLEILVIVQALSGASASPPMWRKARSSPWYSSSSSSSSWSLIW